MLVFPQTGSKLSLRTLSLYYGHVSLVKKSLPTLRSRKWETHADESNLNGHYNPSLNTLISNPL